MMKKVVITEGNRWNIQLIISKQKMNIGRFQGGKKLHRK
jgi:hypothetical protein